MADPAGGAFDAITILLADDHALVRGGLKHLLEAEEDFRVVAEACPMLSEAAVTKVVGNRLKYDESPGTRGSRGMRRRGLEPPRTIRSTRPSTWSGEV